MGWFENLKRIKSDSGMSIHEIAEKSGLPEPTLEKIFSGATKSPGIGNVQTVVHALGCTLDDIDPRKKNSPSAAEATPGEDDIKLMNYLKRGIYDMGYLPEGTDLTDQQLEALFGVCAILHAIFDNK